LFSASLLLDLDEYRRFRHRVRHIYGYELEAARVLTLARGVEPLVKRIQAAVTAFGKWLEEQGREEGKKGRREKGNRGIRGTLWELSIGKSKRSVFLSRGGADDSGIH